MTFPSADFGGHTIAVSDLTRWQGQPLIAFLGVATEGSFIHDVFPAWADVLGIDWALRGVDLPLTAGPAAYRSLLTALHTTTAIAGAVVTTSFPSMHRERTCLSARTCSQQSLEKSTPSLARMASGGTLEIRCR